MTKKLSLSLRCADKQDFHEQVEVRTGSDSDRAVVTLRGSSPTVREGVWREQTTIHRLRITQNRNEPQRGTRAK